MLDANFLSTLDDQALARAAYQFEDPLISTPMEIELRRRYEAMLEEIEPLRKQENALANRDMDAADLENLADALIVDTDRTVALLKVVSDAGFEDPEDLKAELELAKQFRSLAEDAGDVIDRLSQLTTTAKE